MNLRFLTKGEEGISGEQLKAIVNKIVCKYLLGVFMLYTSKWVTLL